MWNFKDNKDLVGVAFIDTDIYSHRAVSLKNFIVVGDIHHSIQLLKYKVTHSCTCTCKYMWVHGSEQRAFLLPGYEH